jgi:hypothetical protein
MIPNKPSDLVFWIGLTCGIASIGVMLAVLSSFLS